MWIFKLTNLVLIFVSAALIAGWTYFEAAVNHFMSEQKTFSYFYLVWGGTFLLALMRCISLTRSISGRSRFVWGWPIKPFTMGLLCFCCGFTLHSLAATTPEFDIDHLNMPFYLPLLFLPLHFTISIWLLFKKTRSEADRGLYLLLLFHTLNGAVFNTEYYLLIGLACLTLIQALIENRGQWRLPPGFIGLPLVLLLVLLAVSAVYAINPIHSSAALGHIGVCATVFAMILSKERPEPFIFRLLLILLFAAGLVLVSAFLLITITSHLLGLFPVLSTRLTLFYQHPNFLAPYFASISLLSLALAWIQPRFRGKSACAVLSFSALCALWLTDSRAGLLGFGAGLSVFALWFFPWNRVRASLVFRHKKIMAGTGLLILLGTAIALGVFSEDIRSAVGKSTRLQRAQDYRIDAWSNSAEIIRRNLWTGIGLNTFMSVKKYPPGSKFAHESAAPHPHNLLLYVAQSCGVPALFFFLLLLGGYAWGTWILIRRTDDRRIKKLVIGCFSASVALLLSGMLDLGLSLVTLFPSLIWIFMAIVSSLCNSHLHRKSRVLSFHNASGIVVVGLIAYASCSAFILPVTGRIVLKRCALSLAEDNEAETVRLAKLSLAADPYLEPSREILLRQYLKDERYEEALQLVEDAVGQQPENAALYMKLGDVLSSSEQHESAASNYLKAVDMDHGSSDLPLYYAKLINEEALLGRREEAALHLEKAVCLNIAVINLVDWKILPHEAGRDDLYLEFGPDQEILRLEAVLDGVYAKLKEKADHGVKQDRFDWFALYQAYHNAFIHTQALAVLDDIETLFGEKEKAVVDCFRAEIAEELGDLDTSRTLISRADAQGDVTNPAAVRYYQSRKSELLYAMDEGRLNDEIVSQRDTLAGLRDFESSRKSFVTVLENLLNALEVKGDVRNSIPLMRSRLFFCSDKLERVKFILRLSALHRAAGQLEKAEESVAEAIDLLADQNKRMAELDDLEKRMQMQEGACLLSRVYEEMNLPQGELFDRVGKTTDLYSMNPARLIFKYEFLIQNGLA
ncbi:MAG: O-antigen ligase family protein, partial [Planctomycetota bacterium]